jgi:hypothetical protein
MLDGIPVSNLTAPGLLGLAVLMILAGFLVPRFVYNEKKQECEKWREAYEAERKARAASDAQTAELLELAKTTHKIIAATFSTTERLRQSGGADALPTS